MSSTCPSLEPYAAGPEPHRVSEAAWSRFVATYHRSVEHGVLRALRCLGQPTHPDRVEDLTQDTYLRLLEMEARGGDRVAVWSRPARIRAVLYRMTWSVVIDACRREGAAKRGSCYRHASPVAPDGACSLDRRPSAEPDPEERLLDLEERDRVRARLRQGLGRQRSDRDRRVVEMVVLEGRSAPEVVTEIDGEISPSGLYSLMRRVRGRLATPAGG
jgi:DNA-directed RNA polymerase specialized sigma24 family protein